MSAVYVASASDNREEAQAWAERVRAAGGTVTSTWHDLPPWDREKDPDLSDEAQARTAMQCLHEIEASDVVLAIGHPRMRGALWECGYAMGLGRAVVWRGPKDVSLFASLTRATHVGCP